MKDYLSIKEDAIYKYMKMFSDNSFNKIILNELSEKEINISEVFTKLVKQNLDLQVLTTDVKNIASIDLSISENISRENIIEFLAKYLLKRRAAHLYIYLLFKKNYINFEKTIQKLETSYIELIKKILPDKKIESEINDLKQIVEEYKILVDEVIPTIANWNDKSSI